MGEEYSMLSALALCLQDPACRTFLGLLVFGWGACVGSYLNVCIYRIPLELSTVKPRSHCPQCKKLIPWYLNIPIFSYAMLGGKCRFCKGRISPRYALVEVLVGILFLLVWLRFDPEMGSRPLGLAPLYSLAVVPILWVAVAGLVLGTFVDFEHLIIPDRVTLGGIVAGLVLSALVPSLHDCQYRVWSILASAAGACLGWGLLWLVAAVGRLIFRREAMGFGDVKLLGAIGAFLGWRAVLFTVVVSSFLGSAIGIAMVVVGCKKMQSRIPYGPYLALAAVLWMLWGPAVWGWYVDLMTPDIPLP